ncbi:MAG: TVP38/TMEM64 family protein [Geminicoccaceae bacterium]|nr:TVP38/TMEM64 family protein [Geminicoccaceae bacterium]
MSAPPQEGAGRRDDRPAWKRWWPLVAILALGVLVLAFDLHQYLSFATLEKHREALLAWVTGRPIVSALVFVLIYAVATALSLPGGAILTVTAGFLFGVWVGAGLSVVGATIGAVAVFLIARTSLGRVLKDKAGPRLARMERGFAENGLSYLLVLRLVPIFPFWLVNIVPALLGVGLATFTLATFVGIIPGSLVFASVGNGLGAVLDAGEKPDLGIIFRPAVLLPMLGLAALAMVPVLYRAIVKRRPQRV